MSSSAVLRSVRHLRRILAVQCGQEQSDAQLLSAFVAERDESAFAALVRRHGPMVLGVCRRVLGHEQDAEDAFQATFLVLAQRAACLRDKAALASFLHGTAFHLASTAKRAAARRRKYEGGAPPQSFVAPSDDLLWREVRSLLDEEIACLPESLRRLFVLCYLENVSQAEAGRRLGLNARTVSNRLAVARQRLQRRLRHRCPDLSAVLAVIAVATPSASALPTVLMASTTKAALTISLGQATSAGISAPVAELIRSAAPAMILSKTKIATAVLLVLGVLASAGWWRTAGVNRLAQAASAGSHRPIAAAPAPLQTKSEEIHGRVLDPNGWPVKDARVYWPQVRKDSPQVEDRLQLVERGQSDEEGYFRLSVPVGDDLDDSLRKLVVTAAGYGLNWVELPKEKSSGEITLRLRKDVTIRGRIVSTEGKPLAGVKVRVELLEELANGRLDEYLALWEQDRSKTYGKTRWLPIPSKQSLVPLAVTDGNGCFQFTGVGSERIVNLAIRGKDIAQAMLPVVARPGFDPAALNKSARSRAARMPVVTFEEPPVLYGPSFDYVALPERIVEGVVREAGSGKPIPGVYISGGTGPRSQVGAITDKEGRYRLEGLPKVKRYPYLAAFPPPNSPWLSRVIRNKEAEGGLQPVCVDFTVGRGVILKGQVIDRTTGKGVVCSLSFAYLPDNKFAGKPGYDPMVGEHASDKDGRFHFKVAPGTGVLKAMPRATRESNPFKPAQFAAEDRKHITLTADGRFAGLGGTLSTLSMLNAVKWLDLAPDAGVVEQNLYPERGATAKVRIHDPEGKPLSGTIVSGIDAMPAQHTQEAYVAREAECTLVALDPPQPRQVVFYHSKRHLAGTLLVRGDEKEPLTVRLAPTGTVIGCLKDIDGQPLEGAEINIGSFGLPMSPNLSSLYAHLNSTGLPVRTDQQGRFHLEGVVPGEKFAVGFRRRGAFLDGGSRTRGLQVKAGETLELGDILIKPPQ